MKKKNFKALKFSKRDVADLTKDEQRALIGGNLYQTITYIYCFTGGDESFDSPDNYQSDYTAECSAGYECLTVDECPTIDGC